MVRQSAGLLLYRNDAGTLEVLLVHRAEPTRKRRECGAWSIPKVEFADGECALEAVRAEFAKRLGISAPAQLKPLLRSGGRVEPVWALEGDLDTAGPRLNTCFAGWSRRSRNRATWCVVEVAKEKILKTQANLLGQLEQLLRTSR
jgi:predicted NUDIX family NTP pyrophosphohydrolase